MTGGVAARALSLDDVPGWFTPMDQALFHWILEHQRVAGVRGDLLELGAYLGKSAIVIGDHIGPGEKLIVCDLFDPAYVELSREAFEQNYRTFHRSLPDIIQGPTSLILEHVPPGSCRFVHVDASHRYNDVRADIASARTCLRRDGIVVFDDFRAAHTPGTAAAVWEAVLVNGLRPICTSWNKLYGTWGNATSIQDALTEWLTTTADIGGEAQVVAGHSLVRIWPITKQADHERCRRCGTPIPSPSATPARKRKPPLGRRGAEGGGGQTERRRRKKGRRRARRSTSTRIVEQLLPPVLLRLFRRARRKLRQRHG